MWSFKRKKPKITAADKLPTEVQDYYEAGRRERKGVAWLLGIATLIVTILLALLLFFGGRWVYHKATNKDNGDTKSGTNQPSSPEQAPANTNNADNAETNASNKAANPPSSSGGSASSSSAPLPRTGPDLDL